MPTVLLQTVFNGMDPLTLAQAIEICREIEEKLKPIGYHCGLTGSTLYKGISTKDIDIIVYPHQISQTLRLSEIIAQIGLRTNMYPSQDCYHPKEIAPSTTDKLVVVGNYNGVRVDLFFLQ